MKIVALALAVIFFIIAILYAAGVLQVGSHHGGRHISHAILFAVLGILSLVWMRFQTGASRTPRLR